MRHVSLHKGILRQALASSASPMQVRVCVTAEAAMVPAAGMWLLHFSPPCSKIHAEVNGLIVVLTLFAFYLKRRRGRIGGGKKKEETQQGVIRPSDKVTLSFPVEQAINLYKALIYMSHYFCYHH